MRRNLAIDDYFIYLCFHVLEFQAGIMGIGIIEIIKRRNARCALIANIGLNHLVLNCSVSMGELRLFRLIVSLFIAHVSYQLLTFPVIHDIDQSCQ